MKKTALIFIFLCGVLLRFLLLFAKPNQVSSSVEALVAKYIMLGKALPLSYPMVHYGDILQDYIAAFMFRLFGISTVSFHSAVILFYSLPAVIFVYFLAKRINKDKNVPFLSLIFMSLPPAVINFYYLHQLSMCLIPLVFLLLSVIIFDYSKLNLFKNKYLYAMLGLIIGVGLWNDLLLLPYITIAALFLFIKDKSFNFKENFLLFTIFTLLGCLPYIVYNIIHPLASPLRFISYSLNVDRSILQQQGVPFILLSKILQKIIYMPKAMLETIPALKTTLGLDEGSLGLFAWLGLPLTALYTISFLYVIYTRRKVFIDFFRFRLKINQVEILDILLFSVIFNYIASVIFGFYGWWRMTLYYPLAVIFMAIFLSFLWQRFKAVSLILVSLLLLANLSSVGVVLKQPIPPYQSLINFLKINDLHAGYSGFSPAYALTLISDEKIIILPTASEKDIGFVEYGLEWPEHKRTVESTEDICYIFDIEKNRLHIPIMHRKLQELRVGYSSIFIPPFYVYYNFSEKVLPGELNLPPLREIR